MTSQQKLQYIESFRKLVVAATTYQSALSSCTYLRGILSAWSADATISLEDYRKVNDDLEVIMQVKRKLPKNEGVLF